MKLQTFHSRTHAVSSRHRFQRSAHDSRRCRMVVKIDQLELSSSKLLQLCLTSRAEAAWYEFVRRYQALISSVIVKTLRRCVNPRPSLIDDLVQETYLKLCADDFKALRRFECRHENSLAGFLKVVASNVTQDYLRGSLSQKRGSGKGEDDIEKAIPTADHFATSAESIERKIMLGQIERCLETECPEANSTRDRKIFWLYYRHGLTARAISRRSDIGLSVKGVESALFRLTRLVKTKFCGQSKHDCRSAKASATRHIRLKTLR